MALIHQREKKAAILKKKNTFMKERMQEKIMTKEKHQF
jgi:hypothetical protein